MNKRLFLLVEGPDDKSFIEGILVDRLRRQYNWISFYLYAQNTTKQINSFLRNISNMGSDYLFFSDLDFCNCVSEKKTKLIEKFTNLNPIQILIVKSEIESWYLSGLSETTCHNIGINNPSILCQSERITKEKFNELMPKRYRSRIDFMQEIIKCYDIDIAKSNNHSLEYFFVKYEQIFC